MAARSSSSESSSDEEEKARLQDAVVDRSLFQQESKKTKKVFHQNKPSLRRQNEDEDERGDYKSVQATKEFRQHVAKRLETMLDSSIDVGSANSRTLNPREEDPSTKHPGFKLLSTSDPTTIFILDEEKEEEFQRKRKMRKRVEVTSSSDSDSADERLQEAAVTQDDIVEMGKRESLFDESKKARGQCEQVDSGTFTNDSALSLKRKKKKKKKHKDGTETAKSENGLVAD